MNDNELIILINDTLNVVSQLKIEEPNSQKLHRERSKNLVEQLADSFRRNYSSNKNIRTFSKHYYEQREEFGLNEYLYDILVCEFDLVKSARQHKDLYYIKEAIWTVESEFAKNSREALKDFNKLVISNSTNKLFIGPLNFVNEKFIDTLLPAAKNCNGNVYACLITHPSHWSDSQIEFKLWKLNGEWELVSK